MVPGIDTLHDRDEPSFARIFHTSHNRSIAHICNGIQLLVERHSYRIEPYHALVFVKCSLLGEQRLQLDFVVEVVVIGRELVDCLFPRRKLS